MTQNYIKRVEVVSAIIRRDGRILLAQRRPNGSHPLLWKSPGGKVEEGESYKAALVREVREELGVVATIGRMIMGFEFDPPVSPWPSEVWLYEATIEGEPRPLASVALRWVTEAEFMSMASEELMPGNVRLREFWRERRGGL